MDSFPPYGVHDDSYWESQNVMDISTTENTEFVTDFEYLMERKQFPRTENEKFWIETNGSLLIDELKMLYPLDSTLPRVAIYVDNTLKFPIIYYSPVKRLNMFINVKYKGHWYVLDLKKPFSGVMSITRGPIYNYFDIVEDVLGEEKTIRRNEYTKSRCIFAMNKRIFK